MPGTWITLANRPDLFEAAVSIDKEANSAGLGQHDAIGSLANAVRLREVWPDYFLVLVDEERVQARAVSIPFSRAAPGRSDLPSNGWDGAVIWALEDHVDGVAATCACALEINVDPALRGQGISTDAVLAMRDNARRQGLTELVAPVRPPDKASDPWLPMAEYAARTRPDGLPVDRWLRVHVRAGGVVVGIAPFSMTVQGTLSQWRDWTGLPFDADGLVAVPGGLVPVLVSQQLDLATYAEPNVWVTHSL